jgi:hypothetical protein
MFVSNLLDVRVVVSKLGNLSSREALQLLVRPKKMLNLKTTLTGYSLGGGVMSGAVSRTRNAPPRPLTVN